MAEETKKPIFSTTNNAGPFIAKVISHLDPTSMGGLEVEIMREVGNDTSTAGQVHQVRYMSPFYGVTSIDFVGSDPNDYNNTQKSYGMWFIPPDVGTMVMIIFIEGDPRKGYWIGCIPDERMNFMIPGIAATKFAQGGDGKSRVPTAEYNKKTQKSTNDANHYQKPPHPFKSVLESQGLLNDDIRGITTSSARREVPSAVFGISTPGPLDKAKNAKKGNVGKRGSTANVFVSRLGGSSFVMDDGDDKFLRKGPASTTGPDYAAVEQGEAGGDVGIPHNELLRLRTRTGHQILLHNSEDLIYIGNARGTTWIELTSNGKIDIYANDSISIHTENDLNVTADRDINFKAGNAINLKSNSVNIDGSSNINLKSNAIKSSLITGEITNAYQAKTAVNNGGYSTPSGPSSAKTPQRVPQHEPWSGHENLDPVNCTPTKTDSSNAGTDSTPSMYNKYTTKVDTFEKISPPEKK